MVLVLTITLGSQYQVFAVFLTWATLNAHPQLDKSKLGQAVTQHLTHPQKFQGCPAPPPAAAAPAGTCPACCPIVSARSRRSVPARISTLGAGSARNSALRPSYLHGPRTQFPRTPPCLFLTRAWSLLLPHVCFYAGQRQQAANIRAARMGSPMKRAST